jgi:leucyl-tRNA synthetase
MKHYIPKEIESRWQEKWAAEKTNAVSNTATGKTSYILDMFPYPSGAGLHVGHPEGYTATDIFARYKRLNGEHVLHPMGWDAFGLPAENYAIKTGVHPAESTAKNIQTFTRQVQSLGFSYDWDREINTSSPEYYKWTQWLFTKMFEAGLVYRKKAKVNWCNTCQTALANAQVIDGKCERSKDEVVQKDLEQWFFKITDYADQLLDDLESLDWPEPLKAMQKNWIGKKDGITITHEVKDTDITLKTFSAYPAWLYADSYIVIAPEHPMVRELVQGTNSEKEVLAFVEEMRQQTTAERGEADKEKMGIDTGRVAIDPLTGEEMSIWLANFALMDFGTGVIRCSGHDMRDIEFAQKYGLQLKEVVDRLVSTPDEPINAHENTGVLKNSGDFTGRSIDDSVIEEMVQYFVSQGYGERTTTYRLRDWLISRQRYWGAPIPIVYDPDGNAHPVKKEHLPLELPTDVDYQPKGTSPIGTSESYKALAEKLYGAGWHFEVDTMDTFVCSSWYYLRYTDPQNTEHFASTEAMQKWLPVDMYVGGAEHAVLHLLYARFFHKALQDIGLIPKEVGREPFKSLHNQGMILGEDGGKMSKSVGNVINPDDVVEEYGADTLRMYEMFMGPFEDSKPWSTKNIKGVYRFLERVWRAVHEHGAKQNTPETSRHIHKTIKKVTEDIEHFRFNTAISEMMIFLNEADYVSEEGVDTHALKQFLILLHPFAPHMTSELWKQMDEQGEVSEQSWPTYDDAKTEDAVVTIGVQVNGKVRGSIELAVDATEENARAKAESNENVSKHVSGKKIVKFIYIPGKIVNIVVQ